MKKIIKKYWWLIVLFLISTIISVKKMGIFDRKNTLVGQAKTFCPDNRIDLGFLATLNKINADYYKKYKIDLTNKITSAYRCAIYNARVGGVPDSGHVKGVAADLKLTRGQAEKLIPIARAHGIKRFLWKADPMHIHIDADRTKPAVENFVV